jgi:hypothetical protein
MAAISILISFVTPQHQCILPKDIYPAHIGLKKTDEVTGTSLSVLCCLTRFSSREPVTLAQQEVVLCGVLL